jgi:hypothetical protein
VLPAGIPTWPAGRRARDERNSTRRGSVAYQLFVRPSRQAAYEVIRYRITLLDPAAQAEYAPNERLQWDLDGRRLRRFELVAGESGERWEELTAGSDRYRRETGVILGLMGLHRELLYRRDQERR